MPKYSRKWEPFGTSIFTLMTQTANAAGAVNLAQGFPDFDGPDAIKAAAIEAVRGHRNQYAPSAGLPELRQLLAQRQERWRGVAYDWQREVTVFSGATEAIFCAMQAFFEPGDEIVAFEPFFDCYPAAAFSSGARIVGVPLVAPDFRFSAATLAAAVTPRTRALLLNTPHNPTGRVFSRDELKTLRDFVLAHDLLVITDEVYEELTFGVPHTSLASLPGMAERSVVISSTAKTFSLTGWKVGYAFAPAPLTVGLRAVHQFTVFCSATPLQAGMIAALSLDRDYFDDLRRGYLERRDALLAHLLAAGFRAKAPEGAYFILADYTEHADVPDIDFAMTLTNEYKVAAIPISVFYSDQRAAAATGRYVRFAFCKDTATLDEAGRRLLINKKILP